MPASVVRASEGFLSVTLTQAFVVARVAKQPPELRLRTLLSESRAAAMHPELVKAIALRLGLHEDGVLAP